MSTADNILDARLRALDPSPAARRPQVADTDWGAAIAAQITATPGDPRFAAAPARPRRSRRVIGAALSGAGVLALVALMAVLLVSTGGKDTSAPAGSQVELIASPLAGAAAITPALLSRTASTIRARAAALGVPGVTASPQGAGRIILGLPEGAAARVAADLTAPGRLRIEAADPQTPGAPVITAEDIDGASVVENGGTVSVAVTFTGAGATEFRHLTRALAQTGALRGEAQALSITLDGRELSAPTVDYETYPNGIDGRSGASLLLPAGMDPRVVAAQVASGPLPLALTLAPGTRAPPATVERVDPGPG